MVHNNKYDNYGEKVLEAMVKIIQKPVNTKICCPHCDEVIYVEYNQFKDLIGSEYPGDWISQILECPYCRKDIKIVHYEWD